MRIAVAGAAGTAGSRVVRIARARDHEVVPVSRRFGVDLVTGTGLTDALQGTHVVIDASDPAASAARDTLPATMASATRRLADAALLAGVEHLVHLSIANIDKPELLSFPYYEGKRAQVHALSTADLPFTVVRSTQWHEFSTHPSVVTSGDRLVTVQNWLIQPVAVAAVAEVLVDEAEMRGADRTLAGPEVISLPALVARRLGAERDKRPVVTVDPGLGALRTGALLAPPDAMILGPDVASWITAYASHQPNTHRQDLL